MAIHKGLFDQFVGTHATVPRRLVLDFDATDTPLHGEQEDRFLHGYYGSYCYLPWYVVRVPRPAPAGELLAPKRDRSGASCLGDSVVAGEGTAIPASCGKAVPASFEWLPLDVFHSLGSFRALVQPDPAAFWLRWAAGFCADQGMPGSHVDGSRRGARDQEAQDALHYGGRKPGSGRPELRSGSAPARASYNCSQLWRISSQIAPRIFSHRDA